ncbi:MAG TPA: betaine/proline/choline family ABC transporter ATP-binding protein [Actinomycetota bacterium]|nr:betaine/proline/choline family ABC transporter ATP-binding protein [Actinomycetota bacterium]
MITLRNVSKQFPGSRDYAVKDFSLEIAEGETVVLVGPSGSGKTTVLRMINRLIEPTSGTILVDGTDVMSTPPVELRRRIGYVIQSIGLMPHRTVAQNIGMVCALVGWNGERIRARVTELAGMLELDPELLGRYPPELSGGQRQRVGVARALGVDPPVMLMDEPFGAVDPIVRARLQDQLLNLQSRIRKTIVLVTHDIDEAMKLGDRIAIINRGGLLEQYASPEEILRAPASAFVADFIGAERGLKRLALMAVKSVDTEPGPVVGPESERHAALEVMRSHGTDWVAVVDAGEHLLGWVDARGLSGHATVGEAEARPFSAVVSPTSSLREALDAIVTNRTHVAAVIDDGRYCGLLTLERVAQELTAT